MAMDNFLEEVATKRNRGAETVMYVLANIMMVVFGLWAFLMLQGIMMLINAGEGAGPIIYYVVMTLLTGGIAVLLTGYLPLGAVLIAALAVPVGWLQYGGEAGVILLLNAGIMLTRHWPGLVRMYRGEEPQFFRPKH